MDGITEKVPIGSIAREKQVSPKGFRVPPLTLFVAAMAVLALCFAKPLYDVIRLSLQDDMYSHCPLVPAISAYLIWTRRKQLPGVSNGPVLLTVAGLLTGGLLLVAPMVLGVGEPIATLDFRLLSLLVFGTTAVSAILGFSFVRSIAFPIAFLLFALPLPPALINPMEIASQHASAEVYSWMLDLSRSTYFREGLVFVLPGLSLQVAQECSGIRSSFVLFMVSLLASYMFLNSPRRRLALALFVFPLGIIRNAFRIFALSMLTIHWDPRVIDSALHHKGGPIFFAISLIPFSLFLMWLCRSERKSHSETKPTAR